MFDSSNFKGRQEIFNPQETRNIENMIFQLSFLIPRFNSLEVYTRPALRIFNALIKLFIGIPQKVAPSSSSAERGRFGGGSRIEVL